MFTSIAPLDVKGAIPTVFLERSEEVCLKSAALIGSHIPFTIDAMKD